VKLTYLNLSRNVFKGPIPACIGSLTLLKELDLSNNFGLTGVFPVGICDLVNLEWLEIEDTSVEGIIPYINSQDLYLLASGRLKNCIIYAFPTIE
jgi:Leucine-rich repeat (LRR) protein